MSALESNYEGLVSELVPLRELSRQSQAQILNGSEVLRYPRGSFVFKEGDQDSYSFYLLEGRLELISGGQTIRRLSGGETDAFLPLAQLQPRKMSARTESDVVVLRVDRTLVESLCSADIGPTGAGGTFLVEEIEAEADDDWMTRMLQSKLFANLPASNIHRIFSMLETVEATEGDIIVRQDDPGDFYYVLVSGRAEITRSAGGNAPAYRLALIGAGDAFGEEALVGEGQRNATVRMLTNGQLVRLSKEHFIELIRKPLLSAISLAEGRDIEASRGATWLDVRFPEEHKAGALPGSINHPLNTLRMHSGRLDTSLTYIVYCDNGTRSSIAAFLLAERGFDVHFLEGGLGSYETDVNVATAAPAIDLSLQDDESAPEHEGPASAPIPTSHRMDVEREPDPAVSAAALSVQLEVNNLRLADSNERANQQQRDREAQLQAKAAEEERRSREQAMKAALEEARKAAHVETEKLVAEERKRAKAELDAARRKAEEEAQRTFQEERRKLEQAAAKAREELLEAKRVKEQMEQAKAAAEAKAAEERQAQALRIEQELDAARRAKEELEQLRADAQARLAQERAAQASRVEQELVQARRVKEELEQAKAEAEARIEQERKQQASRVEQVRAEMERRLKDEERKLKESYAWQAEELKRLQEQKRAAEARLHEEQVRVQQQSEESRARLAQAREWQQRLEEVQLASAEEAARREQERLLLEGRLREELKQKVQSERSKLEAELARNAAELQRAVNERKAAEAARAAATEEAQTIIAEFKAAHARKRMQEEADMRVERERLEADSKRLRLALEIAQREKESALERQRLIQAEIETLRRAPAPAATDLNRDLEALEAAADAAAQVVAKTEQARADAQAAAVVSAGNLAAHKVHEEHVRGTLKEELDDWLKEQADLENSDMQREVLANQKVHMERIKKRADAARHAAKAHDQALINELAEHFQQPDKD